MMYQKIAKSASSIAQNSEKVTSPAPRSVNSSPTPISQLTQNFTQIPVHSPIVQAKLTIGAPNDRYEQEADRVAAQVVQQLHRPASVQRQDELNETIQTKSVLQRPSAIVMGDASADLSSAIDRQRGGGQALETGLQQSMGQAMGADFSRVRVHTDGQSDRLNRSIQAKAFTTGRDVFFRQGAYEPSSRVGQELIAHELTHVVQQTGDSQVQRRYQLQPQVKFTASPMGVIQRKESYAYGSANTVPHIHVYSGGDCHLKIVDRGRVRRYNIVQGGKRHSQCDDALAAAAGNQTLIDAINAQLA